MPVPILGALAAAGGLTTKLFGVQAGLDLFGRLRDKIESSLPTFTHTITVSVKGGPEADLRRTWYLCLAALFGRFRNRAGRSNIPAMQFEAKWDITAKVVTATIGYNQSGLIQALKNYGNQAVGNVLESGGLALLQRGPDQITVGGGWPAFMLSTNQGAAAARGSWWALGGIFDFGARKRRNALDAMMRANPLWSAMFAIPTFSVPTIDLPDWRVEPDAVGCDETSPVVPFRFDKWLGRQPQLYGEAPIPRGESAIELPWRRVMYDAPPVRERAVQGAGLTIPILPDDGRLITTGEKYDFRVQNPRPPIDGISRGSLVQLVAQALEYPCYLPPAPPCGFVPLGTSGNDFAGPRLYRAGLGNDERNYNQAAILRFQQEVIEDGASNVPPIGGTNVYGTYGPDAYYLDESRPGTVNIREEPENA